MPVWMTLTPDLGVLDLRELADDGLDRALDVGLDDDVELAEGALLHLREELLQGDALLRAPRELLGADALAAELREVARLALVLDDAGVLAGRGRLVEAEDLDRRAGRRLLHLLAAEVEERAHLAPGVAGDDRVADAERAARDEHGRDRAAADVEAALDDRPGGLRLRVCLELELGVGDEQDLLEEVVEPLAGLGGDVGELRRPSPLLGLEVVRDELLAHLLRVGLGLVDLVDGDEHRHLGGAARG